MNDTVQHILVFIAAAVAAWAAWRNLRGRSIFRRSKPQAPADGCSTCSSAAEHRRD